jgi:hypothetical protein
LPQRCESRLAFCRFVGLNATPKTRSACASTFGGIVRPIRFAAFQIDYEFKLHWLLDGQVSGLSAFKYSLHIGSGVAGRARRCLSREALFQNKHGREKGKLNGHDFLQLRNGVAD